MGRAGYKWKSDKQVWQARKTEKALGVAEQLGYTEEETEQEIVERLKKHIGESWKVFGGSDESITDVVKVGDQYVYRTSKGVQLYRITDLQAGKSAELEQYKADEQQRISEEAEKQAKIDAENNAIKQEAQKKLDVLEGFASDKSDFARTRIANILNKKFNYEGYGVQTRADFVKLLLKDGYSPDIYDNEYYLSKGKLSQPITKTEYDFANYLLEKQGKGKIEPKVKAKPSADTFSKNPDALFNTNALAGAPKQVTDIIQKMPKAEQSKTTKKQTAEKQETKEPATRFDGERARKSLDALIGRKKKSEPQKNDVVPKSKFMNVFNEDELDAEIEKAKKEMSKLSANPMFNPALMKSLFKIGGIYLQKGVNKFAAWADNMVDVMGEKVRPFLPAVWDSLKKYPDNQKFNDDVMTAVMEYVGEGVDNGKSLSAIKREFADDYGDEYLGYVDAAFEGVKKYPTSDNVADVVESKQDNTEGGKENRNNEARSGSVSENQQS